MVTGLVLRVVVPRPVGEPIVWRSWPVRVGGEAAAARVVADAAGLPAVRAGRLRYEVVPAGVAS